MTLENEIGNHTVDADNDEPLYNVYTLFEGFVDNEESFWDYDSASYYYDEVVKANQAYVNKNVPKDAGVEITVTMLDTVLQNIERQETIIKTN